MKLPGKEIRIAIQDILQKRAEKLTKRGHKPHLLTILIGTSEAQMNFITLKQKMATKLGAKFTFIHLEDPTQFIPFIKQLKKYAVDPSINGIIIQHPLPFHLQSDSIYNYIPSLKEIEGHRQKTPFYSPIGLATATFLKYIFNGEEINDEILFDTEKDSINLKSFLKNKRIVIIGRGISAGLPIAKTFSLMNIPFLHTNSTTYKPEEYYRAADIIITATGKEILTPDMLKPGVILLNLGLRKDGDIFRGDYDENKIETVASYYSPTPGGIGPVDILYLYNNLIQATEMQSDSK
ncbi:MAG: bifunctional 5,10-methylenetetrahydrofolate dehydrogenase/5,10-methenyltetrahydrofolate cyclohydrolase [Candidatus Roizmanbacteria bacterium]